MGDKGYRDFIHIPKEQILAEYTEHLKTLSNRLLALLNTDSTWRVKRTIGEYQQIGAAGVRIEDQTFPKRCGQTAGASLIPTAEMCAKIYAAKEAADDEFVVAVRTDARQTEGMDGVLARSRAYVDAGCDAIFPEALLEPDEFRRTREELPGVALMIDVPEWDVARR